MYRLICGGSVEEQMLDRIRRKLFLSLKVMGGDTSGSDNGSALGTSELMDILRKGSSALSRGDNVGMDLNQFLGASVDEIMEASRKREDIKEVKMKREIGDGIEAKEEPEEEVLHDLQAEEQKLLSGIAVVQSRLFEGQIVEKVKNSNKDIAHEWQEVQKRARINRTVTIDGIQVIADHVAPLAVSTSNHILFILLTEGFCNRLLREVNRRSALARKSKMRTGVYIAEMVERWFCVIIAREVRDY